MRVLHISSGNLYGGVETLLVTLARYRHFCDDMEPHFALSFDGRVSRELRDTGVSVHLLGEVRASRPWTISNARKRLKAVLKNENFQAVVCHMPWPLAMFGSAVQGPSKLAFWLHNPVNGHHWIEHLARKVKPGLAICNSDFTAKSLPKLFPGIRQITSYCPVELDQKQIKSVDRDLIRREMGLQEQDIAIVQISRMEAWKGHLLHLKALSLMKDLPNWTGWFVGGAQRPSERTYFEQVQKAAMELGLGDRVRFLGQRLDVPELLSASDIFCQPNDGPEPFGIVFIEALLSGLPVVSTAIGGALEIVDDSCGRLVPPNNPIALAGCLRELVLSSFLRRKLGGGGPARARLLCHPKLQLDALKNALCSIP